MPIQQRSQLKGFGQSTNEKYIVEDINDIVSFVNEITPTFYLNASGGTVIGPNVGTVEISESILIPANTLNSDAIIELLFRVEKLDSATTGFTCNIYKNTVNSLVGASLLGNVATDVLSKTYSTNANRTILFKNSKLQVIDSSFTTIDDFIAKTGGPVSTIALNSTYDNYIIIAVGDSSLTSKSQVTLAKLNINA